MNAAEKIIRARTLLVLDHPFFGTLALRMVPTPDQNIKTLCTNGKTLKYNPDFVMETSDLHLKAMLAHEVMHVANGHTWRRGNRDKTMWNKAGDYAINHLLISAGLHLPTGALVDASLGASAEQVYSKLMAEQEQQPQPQPGDKSDGQGQPQPDGGAPSQSQPGQGEGQGDQSGNPTPSKGGGKGQNNPTGQSQPEDGVDGGGQDENPTEGNPEGQGQDQEPVQDPGGCGAVDDAPVDEKTEQEAEWRVAVSQAAQLARSQGCMPASLERMVQAIVYTKVPWTVLLRDFVERTARNDYNWSRANVRFMGQGVILPTLINDEIPTLVIAVDTSGSIDDNTLAQFSEEVSTILGVFETTIHVVYCDAKVQGTEEYTRADLPLHLQNKGGGGTDFRPPFQWVEEQGITPACLIYLTDLYGDFPTEEPDYPVMWVTVDEGNVRRVPFGEVAKLGD